VGVDTAGQLSVWPTASGGTIFALHRKDFPFNLEL